jgi:hypothetical protein
MKPGRHLTGSWPSGWQEYRGHEVVYTVQAEAQLQQQRKLT